MTQDERYAELLKRARAGLSIDATPDAKARIETRLERLAAELLLEWIVGDRRFESPGQQTEYWLSRMSDEIFSDEQPESTRIYERFTMSLPRAG